MADQDTVRVHFIDGSERIVSAKNIHQVGEEGARSAVAIVDGREVPIYNRVEWGFLWEEQTTIEEYQAKQACIAAQEYAAHDIPYVEVGEARPYQYHEASGRWYVEVDLQHTDPDQGAAVALYRVWKRPDGSMAAIKVDIREAESE